MNRLVLRTTLVLMTALTMACNHQYRYNATIERADSLLNTDPHAALLDIYGRKDSLCANEGDSAYYELVYMEVMHETGVKLYDTTYIAASANYFDSCGDRRNALRAKVQHALCMINVRNLVRAIDILKPLEHSLIHNDDPHIRFKIADAMAMVNTMARDHALVMRYRRMQMDAAEHTKDSRMVAQTWNDMATEYMRVNMTDSFMVCMSHCATPDDNMTIAVRADIMTNMGYHNIITGDTAKAIQLLTEAQENSTERTSSLLLGNLYEAQGKQQQALLMWYDATNANQHDIAKAAFKKLLHYAQAKGDEQSERYLLAELNRLYNSDMPAETTAELVGLQNDHDLRAAELNHRHTTERTLAALAALAITALCMAMYHRRRMRHYDNVIDRQNSILQQLNADYANNLQRYNELAERLKSMQSEHSTNNRLMAEKEQEMEKLQALLAEYQNDRQRPSQWNMTDSMLNDDSVYVMHRLAATGKSPTKQHWDDLHAMVNEHDQRLAALFCNNRNLSPNEINTIILTRLRFIPTEIAVLTGVTAQAVTNTRARLLTKVFGTNGGAREFDDRIRNL